MTRRSLGVFSWMLFDWAAQPYHTVLITFVFAPYFVAHVAPDPELGQQYWAFATAIAGVIIAILAPLLGALTDQAGARKPFIMACSIPAVIGAALLFLATPDDAAPIFLVLCGFIIALIGVEFATIFTNAMMPFLARNAELGRLSGSGWALGYVGGVISLLIVLGFMSASPDTGRTLLGFAPVLGLDPSTHAGDRASGPFTALWYLVFILPLLAFTPDAPRTRQKLSLRLGLQELWQTLESLRTRPAYLWFLISSMIYRDGLNALYAFGGIYAAGVLGLTIIQIGVFGIIAAIAGAIGAFAGGRFDAHFGPRPVVFMTCWLLVLACLIVVSTTANNVLFVIPTTSDALPTMIFYIAGALIGAAGGALQAASRTLLVHQVSAGETTRAFGLYALTGRATAFIGPLLIGLLTAISHDQRIGITPIILLLILGALGLQKVRPAP